MKQKRRSVINKENGLNRILSLIQLRNLEVSEIKTNFGEMIRISTILGRTNGYIYGLLNKSEFVSREVTQLDEAYLLTVQKINSLYSRYASQWAEEYNSQQINLGSRKRIRPIQEGRNYGIVFEKT